MSKGAVVTNGPRLYVPETYGQPERLTLLGYPDNWDGMTWAVLCDKCGVVPKYPDGGKHTNYSAIQAALWHTRFCKAEWPAGMMPVVWIERS